MSSLQRGRARVGAELDRYAPIDHSSCRFNGAAPAQARMICTVPQACARPMNRFNGAAPAARNCSERAFNDDINRVSLQRGRARAGAEFTPLTSAGSYVNPSFNGAAPAWARNSKNQRTDKPASDIRFNGAAPARARNGERGRFLIVPGFNGAAPPGRGMLPIPALATFASTRASTGPRPRRARNCPSARLIRD